MEKNHKHKGLLTSSGGLRSHPITRMHKDAKVQKYHMDSIKRFKCGVVVKKTKTETKALKKVKKEFKSLNVTFKKGVVCPVDSDGFINIDLMASNLKQRGVRIKFQRTEGRTRKTVGLEIEK